MVVMFSMTLSYGKEKCRAAEREASARHAAAALDREGRENELSASLELSLLGVRDAGKSTAECGCCDGDEKEALRDILLREGTHAQGVIGFPGRFLRRCWVRARELAGVCGGVARTAPVWQGRKKGVLQKGARWRREHSRSRGSAATIA